MKYLFHNSLRTVLVLSVILGLVTISFAQTKPTAKRRTTTRRVVPLVPVGTDLKVRINDTLSSKDSRVGDRFTATVIDPSRFDEARLYGHVSSIQKSGKIKGRTSMNLAFDSVEMRDGRKGVLHGYVTRVYGDDAGKADEEGGSRIREQDQANGQARWNWRDGRRDRWRHRRWRQGRCDRVDRWWRRWRRLSRRARAARN